jgi:hypothetical protein
MSALTVDLMGNTPMGEATIQARAQDIIAATWPAWKRERALRLGDVTALNAYMDTIAAEVDLARSNSALLAGAIAYEAAQARLLEDAEDAEAQAVIDGASEQVLALVASRVPVPEHEPEAVDAPA